MAERGVRGAATLPRSFRRTAQRVWRRHGEHAEHAFQVARAPGRGYNALHMPAPDLTPPTAVSLVPAATEIVAALGHVGRLAAVSHDCDWPPEVRRLPRLTHCEIHGADLPSAAIDDWVDRTLAERGTLYTIDEPLLRRIAPDVILTQGICDVCAPSHGSVAALAEMLPSPPRVVSLDPESLDGILVNVMEVAEALGEPASGEALLTRMSERIDFVRKGTRSLAPAERPRVFLLEWIEPLYASGHWGPELMEIAGGAEVVGIAGQPSRRATWEQVRDADPEVLVIACCGNPVDRTLGELSTLVAHPAWGELAAVRQDRVWVADGSAYFSRPGPRIVDSLELLAGVLHPDRFPSFRPERAFPGAVAKVHVANLESAAASHPRP